MEEEEEEEEEEERGGIGGGRGERKQSKRWLPGVNVARIGCVYITNTGRGRGSVGRTYSESKQKVNLR